METRRLAGLGLLLMTPSVCPAQGQTRQNILYIMTDQQSYYAVSALAGQLGNSPYGHMDRFSTPNLDRLVREGYTFTRCYAANPVSGPSRFALLTGESPKAYGMNGNYSPSGENGRRMLEVITTRAMGSLFRDAGYDTFYAGKVHLPWAGGTGGRESIYNPPVAYGFNHVLTDDDREGLAGTCVDFFDSDRPAGHPFLLFVSFMNPHDICMSKLLFGNRTLDDFQHNPRELGARRNQLRFRDLYQSMDPSLFDSDTLARLPDNFQPSEGFPPVGKEKPIGSDPHAIRAHLWFYYRLVEQVDGMIGQVLDALERSPYKDNTTIVFTSDHGEMGGSHGRYGKNVPFEECQRVPFIFVGKDIPRGVTDDTPVCNGWDLLPTLLDVAGIPAPRQMKGQSLYGRMTTGADLGRKYLYLESVDTYGILEDGRYKFTALEIPDGDLGGEALTDLTEDPGEKRNRAQEHPGRVRRLRKVLNRELARFREGRPLTKQ